MALHKITTHNVNSQGKWVTATAWINLDHVVHVQAQALVSNPDLQIVTFVDGSHLFIRRADLVGLGVDPADPAV